MKRRGRAIVYLGVLLVAGTVFGQQAQQEMQQPAQPPAGGQQMTCPYMGNRMMQQNMGGGMQQGMMCPMMQQRGMMHQGMRQDMQQRGMMDQQMGQMRNMAPQASMVASDNGGVIVLSGNKLMKFDKNLKLLKEVELFPRNKDKKEMQGTQKTQPPAEKK